ncbi:predicted protein [Naegleria gruberi]|uniref:Predicted protein n=1 Tax=Naegleria gruberi TaxID=5762 RepID=D2V6U7_NAEGR|nr:uncharacterized protein NAEGRDRAFT_47131 [Naegleria gruberi]EFC47508.1 predicted protein [Naegleria gruberi]|eukprot:XP_002680252.1 predicted protein [Naegleria gruberi strain NEG-M]
MINRDNDEDKVSFTFFNFTQSEVCNPLYAKLREKLSSNKSKTFSMQFTPHKTIGYQRPIITEDGDVEEVSNEENKLKLHYPSDIKIARHHGCLVIADDHNDRIVFLNLDNYQLRTEFILEENVTDFWIESDSAGNEYIYFGDNGITFKFNIAKLVEHAQVKLKDIEPMWKISEKLSGSIMVIHDTSRKEKVVLRWNNDAQGLNAHRDCDGSLLAKYPVLSLCDSPGLFAISNSEFIALNHESNMVFKITFTDGKCENSDMFQVQNHWKHPLSVAKELNQPRIYISDYGNKRIVVWDLLQGCEIKIHHEEHLHPFGIFYDDQSGLLYVVDQQASIIRVYQ